MVVWTDFSHGNARIDGQLFNSHGGKVGPILDLASAAGVAEEQPSVAMDAKGNFVVSWTQFFPNGASWILAQKFNAAGETVNGVVPVGVGTFPQSESSVAMDAKGDFVVAYTRETNFTTNNVFAKIYNTNSQLVGVTSVGGTEFVEDLPSVAMTPNGQFDVAFQEHPNSTTTDIATARYTATGGLLGQFAIDNSGLAESPSIAIDNHGNAVIAYQQLDGNNWDVEARRLSSTGNLSGTITVQATAANETVPSVALEGNAGAFVVAYDSNVNVNVTEVNASNVVISTRNAGPLRFSPRVSINAQNKFLLAYEVDIAPTLSIAGRFGSL